MKFAFLAATVLFCFVTAPASAVDVSKCRYEIDATNAALGMCHFGKTKVEVEATLPPRSRTVGDPKADFLHRLAAEVVDQLKRRTAE